jgi:8-oxo-dGTP diphosphatase
MAHLHEAHFGDHDQTASAFIVRTDFETPKLLLHKHRKLGVLLQPGGHVELSENPWQAVLHEILEETGYTASELKVLQPSLRINSLSGAVLHPYPLVHNTHNFFSDGSHKHTDISYAFTASAPPLGSPAEGESKDMRWLSLEEIDTLGTGETFENVREIGRFLLASVINEWEPVDVASVPLE